MRCMMNHKHLQAWKLGIDFVVLVYELSSHFPKHELHGLTNQIRRAAVSIPSNIAEGSARNSTKEFTQYLHIALGSLAEAETQMIIAKRLGHLPEDTDLFVRCQSLRVTIRGLVGYVKATAGTGQR